MGERLNAFVKPDIISEAKTMTKKLVKVANDAKANGNKTNAVKTKIYHDMKSFCKFYFCSMKTEVIKCYIPSMS